LYPDGFLLIFCIKSDIIIFMEKDFNSWNNIKQNLDKAKVHVDFHIREIWFCSVGCNIGIEENGKHENFERPVLVLKKFNKDMLLIAPLTSNHHDLPFYHLLNYETISSVMLSQIKIIDTRRLIRKVRTISEEEFLVIKDKIRKII
jgi:mRNA interferase MazF